MRKLIARLPLQIKLPLGASVLVCVTAGIIALAAVQQVRQSASHATAGRLSGIVDRMSNALAEQGRRIANSTQVIAADSRVIDLVRRGTGPGLARERTDGALPPTDTSTIALGIWSGDGRLLRGISMYDSLASVAPRGVVGTAAWSPDSVYTGPIIQVDSMIVFPVIAPVRDAGATFGHVVKWYRIGPNASVREQITSLIGSDGMLLIGSPGGAWTDQAAIMPPPPVDPATLDTMVQYHRDGYGSRLGMAHAIAGTPWMVLVEFPLSVVGLPVSHFIRRVAVVALAVTLLGFLAAWVMGRHITTPIRELTGAVRSVNTNAPPTHVAVTGDHEVAHLATAFNQMADRVGAEAEARRSSEAQWRLLFASNPHPMWVFDTRTFAFLAVNDAAMQQYGYTREEFLTMTIADIRPSEEVPRLQAAMAAVDAGLGHPAVWRHKRRDGTLIDVEVHSHGIEFDQRPARLVLAHDVTARLALEAQLRQAQKMEAIGQLAGGVAHDFNNLLTVIMAYSEMIAEQSAPDDPRSEDIQQVIEASRKAHGLTRQLLAFSRRQVLQPTVLNPNVVIESTDRLLRPLLGETVSVVLRLSPDTGNVLADLGQLEQVLVNLAVNARDAMPAGGTLTISTSATEIDEVSRSLHGLPRAGRFVVISVSDTGTGMSAETRSRVFEPFFTTKVAGRGTGLGLATVYGIVSQSGGHVTVYSEEGVGSTFRVYLPATDASVPPSDLVTRSAMPHGTETVLLVEDDAAVRAAVETMLRRLSYSVHTAASGAEALEVARGTRPDLVISDVVMPGIDGPTLIARLREEFPDIRALLVSGYAGDAIPNFASDASPTAFLEKPFSVPALAAKIRAVLDA